ncbi:response regulator [Paenibacillus sp. sgz500958]|uniref:response regulator n=1 Tax=Paenibacillus sp. sgz500958 TaxID=3242475 RepID=UPI0036D3352D
MLRIVIVDDEVLIREGLARMISKESSNFQIVGTYPDGKQVLEELSALQFEVVITDIRMPQIDGLELIKQLKVSHPQIRSILMSGFVEFDYAREAIRSSAVDYLLKPINKEQLFELLHRLENERRMQCEKEERQRSGLLLSLLHIDEPSPALLTSLTLPQPYYSMFALKGSSYEAVCAATDSLRQEKDSVFDHLELFPGLHLCICYSEVPHTRGMLLENADALRSIPQGYVVHAGSSRSYQDAARISKAFLEARLACDAGIYSPGQMHYAHIEDIKLPETGPVELFIQHREALIHDLQILNVQAIMERIHNLFWTLKSQQADTEVIHQICRLIIETAGKEIQEFDEVYRFHTGSRLEEEIRTSMNFDATQEHFASRLYAALNQFRSHRLEMSGTAVETIKRWISANYNQHAELNTLAGMVFLTPSYLSKLFKQETGLTLTDYIIEIRIRKAKLLLKNSPDLKIHEIGFEVGYSDPAYFNKLFKRVVGVTPNEYKRIALI